MTELRVPTDNEIVFTFADNEVAVSDGYRWFGKREHGALARERVLRCITPGSLLNIDLTNVDFFGPLGAEEFFSGIQQGVEETAAANTRVVMTGVNADAAEDISSLLYLMRQGQGALKGPVAFRGEPTKKFGKAGLMAATPFEEEVFGVAQDLTRQKGSCTAKAVANQLGISGPHVHHHLKPLEVYGAIGVTGLRQRGSRNYYRAVL